MKASISYTVNFKDIPAELIKFVSRAEEILGGVEHDSCWEKLRDAISGNNFDLALEQIHEIRTTLADVDLGLNDCNLILEGYLRAKYSEAETQTPAASFESPPTPAPASETFDMEKELANLKKSNPRLFPKATKKEEQ